MAIWQVCIQDREGGILGAGVLLDSEYILTCAHVAEPGMADEAGAGLRVRFDGRDDMAPCDASVVPGCFVREDRNERGDVALLRLRTPVPGQPRIMLRRQFRRRQRVSVFGYPAGLSRGEWAAGTVAGEAAAHCGLVQLDDRSTSPPVERGFSGAGVIADDTEEIIGMIKDRKRDRDGTVCWMIPVDAAVESVPRLSRYVSGPSSDPGFADDTGPPVTDPVQRALLRELAVWLGSGGPDGICVVAGGPASVREALLSRLARPGMYAWRGATGPRGVDVAVHAAGKTADQVFRRLVAGLGGGAENGADVTGLIADLVAPAAAVVDGVDACADPSRVLDTLAGIVTRSPRPAVRLLLGLSGPVPDGVRAALVAELPERWRRGGPGTGRQGTGRQGTGRQGIGGQGIGGQDAVGPDGDAEARLGAAATVLGELLAAEEDACHRHGDVTRLIADVPPLDVAAGAALTVRLSVLRRTRGHGGGWWTAELAACEDALEDRLSRAKETVAELDGLVHRRDTLRGTLLTYRQTAAEHGFDEDRRLSLYYRNARGVLWRAPCDLRLAEVAVESYYGAVMRRVSR